jgi:hypothetical protein
MKQHSIKKQQKFATNKNSVRVNSPSIYIENLYINSPQSKPEKPLRHKIADVVVAVPSFIRSYLLKH